MSDLLELSYGPHIKLASFVIANMYSNIPTSRLPTIIKLMCFQIDINKKLAREILKMTRLLLKQNYFRYRYNLYTQKEGLAMGAPTSSLFSKVYLQYIEHTLLFDILVQSHILGYFRYVDDILIVYNAETKNIYEVLDKFNNITPTIQYTIETEQDSTINFLDLTNTKTSDNRVQFSIFRKPTATDTIIPRDSCHPIEHKMSAIRYLLNRNTTYLLTSESRQREDGIIDHILRANQYDTEHKNMCTTTPNTMRDVGNQSKKRVKFTYTGKEVRTSTKLFKHTNLNIAFTPRNTIGRLLSQDPHIQNRNLYNRSGVYQLTCPTCKMKYIGQTGRSFHPL
jgi:hypothetical protein